MTIDAVKNYLRIDEDADDAVIEIMMRATEQYIEKAVAKYDDTSALMQMLYFAIMQDLYENRVLVVKEADKQRLAHVVSSIVLQLQTDELLKQQEGDADG